MVRFNTEQKNESSLQRRGKYVFDVPPRTKPENLKYVLSLGAQLLEIVSIQIIQI